jgi:hypothetical protein
MNTVLTRPTRSDVLEPRAGPWTEVDGLAVNVTFCVNPAQRGGGEWAEPPGGDDDLLDEVALRYSDIETGGSAAAPARRLAAFHFSP